jgi:site-specific recombinase XerD
LQVTRKYTQYISFLYLYGGKTPKYSKIMQHGGKQNILEDFTKLMKIKRYAPSSIRSYKNAISLFLDAFPDKNPENISIREIEEFLYRKIKQDNISASYQKTLVGAIQFLYNNMWRKNFQLKHLYPDRREYKLPVVLSKEEVQITSNTNLYWPLFTVED